MFYMVLMSRIWLHRISFSTKLMQHNYSYLKILKLKINSFFLVTIFCTLLAIRVFSLLFSTSSPKFLPLVSLKSSLNWPKIRNGFLLQNKQIVKWWNFVKNIKIFTRNNFHCVDMILAMVNLLSFLFVLTHSR